MSPTPSTQPKPPWRFQLACGGRPRRLAARQRRQNNIRRATSKAPAGTGWSCIPAWWSGPRPRGPVTDEAFNTMTAEMIRRIRALPKLARRAAGAARRHGGGELAAPATRSWCGAARRRRATGAHRGHARFHANIPPGRSSNCAMRWSPSRRNPHIDTKERGLQAARIMAETVRGKVRRAGHRQAAE